MKKFSLTSLLIIITLGFSSCTQDDNTFLEEPTAEDLLKSFNLNKSADGDFSLDYQLGKGVASDNILDEKTNTNNIYLYSSEGNKRLNSNQDLAIKNGELKVSFNDTERNSKHIITILDDDIQMKSEGNIHLESYEVSGNGNGTYDLNFTIVDGTAVDFVFDDDTKVYEIHLSNDDNASQKEYMETFTKQDGVALNIQFFDNSAGYDRTSESSVLRIPEPIIIVEEGNLN